MSEPTASPASFPIARALKWVAIAMVGAATALLAYAEVGSAEFKVYLGTIGAGAALGIGSGGIRHGAGKALAVLLAVGISAPAMASDVPLAEAPPLLTPRPVDMPRCRHLRGREKAFAATSTGAKYVTVGLGGAAGGLLAKHLNDRGVGGDTVLAVTLVALVTGAVWQVADSLATSYAKDVASERCPVSAP